MAVLDRDLVVARRIRPLDDDRVDDEAERPSEPSGLLRSSVDFAAIPCSYASSAHAPAPARRSGPRPGASLVHPSGSCWHAAPPLNRGSYGARGRIGSSGDGLAGGEPRASPRCFPSPRRAPEPRRDADRRPPASRPRPGRPRARRADAARRSRASVASDSRRASRASASAVAASPCRAVARASARRQSTCGMTSVSAAVSRAIRTKRSVSASSPRIDRTSASMAAHRRPCPLLAHLLQHGVADPELLLRRGGVACEHLDLRPQHGSDRPPEAEPELVVDRDRVGVQPARDVELPFHRAERRDRRREPRLERRRRGGRLEELGAAPERLRHRSRAVVHGLGELDDQHESLALVARLPRVANRTLQGVGPFAASARR